MTREEARIVLLEAALIQSAHTIEFMHGCLTDDSYHYSYPDQTEQRLEAIRKLVAIPESCFHSRMQPETCERCARSLERRSLRIEAEAVMAQVNGDQP